jgi:hypothetical protein
MASFGIVVSVVPRNGVDVIVLSRVSEDGGFEGSANFAVLQKLKVTVTVSASLVVPPCLVLFLSHLNSDSRALV